MDKNDGMEIVYVDPGKITLADKFIDGYINYRHFQEAPNEKKGKAVVVFDDEEMQRLEKDIQQRGLHDPIILVEKDGIHICLSGERRVRIALKSKIPKIPAYVYKNLTKEEMWATSFRSNDTVSPVGENATAALVKYWREKEGFTSEKILEITGRSVQWLGQMDTLGTLDPKCFEAFRKGFLTLRTAIKLANVDDDGLRIRLCDMAIEDSEKDFATDARKLDDAVEKAEDGVEVADSIGAAAKLLKTGRRKKDADIKEDADNKKVAADEKLKDKKKDRATHQRKGAQAKNKNLKKAVKDLKAQKEVPSVLTKSEVTKCLEETDELIRSHGKENGEIVAEEEHLRLAKVIFECVLVGEANIKKIFEEYYAIDEKEFDYEEDI
jgi:hypothetical protein